MKKWIPILSVVALITGCSTVKKFGSGVADDFSMSKEEKPQKSREDQIADEIMARELERNRQDAERDKLRAKALKEVALKRRQEEPTEFKKCESMKSKLDSHKAEANQVKKRHLHTRAKRGQ